MDSNQKVGISHIILNGSIVFHIQGKTYTVNKTDKEYQAVTTALGIQNEELLLSILDKEKAFNELLKANEVSIGPDGVIIDGEAADPYIGKKVIEFFEKRLPFMPLVNFWRRLKLNPSENSRKQLYPFLEAAKCPITEEGNFICMKGVNPTNDPKVFTSGHDRDYKYTLGVMSYMDRKDIPDSPNTACGPGLHGGSYKYAKGWASVVLELLVDPADVVSVPKDESYQKLRACRVLPLAVHVGREYNKGMAIKATESEKASTVVTTKEKGDIYIINKVNYKLIPVTLEEYDKVVDNSILTISGLQRYRASKAPAAFKNAHPDLIESYKMFPSYKSDGIAYYMFSYGKDSNVQRYIAIPEQFDSEKEIVSIFQERMLNIKPKESKVLLSKTGHKLGNTTFTGKEYEAIFFKSFDFTTVDKEEEGISSVINIKPSKVPVGIKSLMDYTAYQVDGRPERIMYDNEVIVFGFPGTFKGDKGYLFVRPVK